MVGVADLVPSEMEASCSSRESKVLSGSAVLAAEMISAARCRDASSVGNVTGGRLDVSVDDLGWVAARVVDCFTSSPAGRTLRSIAKRPCKYCVEDM